MGNDKRGTVGTSPTQEGGRAPEAAARPGADKNDRYSSPRLPNPPARNIVPIRSPPTPHDLPKDPDNRDIFICILSYCEPNPPCFATSTPVRCGPPVNMPRYKTAGLCGFAWHGNRRRRRSEVATGGLVLAMTKRIAGIEGVTRVDSTVAAPLRCSGWGRYPAIAMGRRG